VRATRAWALPLGLYLSVTVLLPILRGTTRGPIRDHVVIVLALTALFGLPLAFRTTAQRGRRS
jgi:hypothetical protein